MLFEIQVIVTGVSQQIVKVCTWCDWSPQTSWDWQFVTYTCYCLSNFWCQCCKTDQSFLTDTNRCSPLENFPLGYKACIRDRASWHTRSRFCHICVQWILGHIGKLSGNSVSDRRMQSCRSKCWPWQFRPSLLHPDIFRVGNDWRCTCLVASRSLANQG